MAKSKPTRNKSSRSLIPAERIERSILLIRGEKVLLDSDLATLYAVETKALTRAVRRNQNRFPADFMFQLTKDKFADLKRHFGTSSQWGGRRFAPCAFTEQGVAMLSSVLRSPRAIEVNIQIMRAFVRIRQLLSVHKELAERPAKLERQMRERDAGVDQQFRHVFSLLEQLFTPPSPTRNPIGFHAKD